MEKETKSKEELSQMMMEQARASGKCGDVENIIVIGPVARAHWNWDFVTDPAGVNCQTELDVIAGRLQAQYDVPRLPKTAAELRQMISDEISVAGVLLQVHPDSSLGWRSKVITAPGQTETFQIQADAIAEKLRKLYTLKKG